MMNISCREHAEKSFLSGNQAVGFAQSCRKGVYLLLRGRAVEKRANVGSMDTCIHQNRTLVIHMEMNRQLQGSSVTFHRGKQGQRGRKQGGEKPWGGARCYPWRGEPAPGLRAPPGRRRCLHPDRRPQNRGPRPQAANRKEHGKAWEMSPVLPAPSTAGRDRGKSLAFLPWALLRANSEANSWTLPDSIKPGANAPIHSMPRRLRPGCHNR